MRKDLLKIFLILILILIIYNYHAFAFELNINPNIETVSSGPFMWNDENLGSRFRLVVVLSEVYLNIFIQKIENNKLKRIYSNN